MLLYSFFFLVRFATMTTVCPVGWIDSPTTYILSCQCNSYGYGLERERERARERAREEREALQKRSRNGPGYC